MEFQNYFPVWNKLNAVQQKKILGSLITSTVKKERYSIMAVTIAQGFYLLNQVSFVHIFFPTKDGRLPFTVCLIGICVCFLHPA